MQPSITRADITKALIVGRSAGLFNNVFLGGPGPTYVTGSIYKPQRAHYDIVTTITTTINRLYFIPFRVWETHTFTAALSYNSGAGDNTETWRQGIYNHTSAGPTTLQLDFGLGTLTGASAVRTLTNSVTLTPGVYWHAFHAATAAAWYNGQLEVTAVGAVADDIISYMGMPVAFLSTGSSASVSGAAACQYVDTAFGALASTAVTPTGTTISFPAVWLQA